MFENLDQKSGQNLTGKTAKPSVSAPAAPKVEDMFAGVRDAQTPIKNASAALAGSSSSFKPPQNKISSTAGQIAAAVVIVLVILVVGVFVAGKILGVQITDSSTWKNQLARWQQLLAKNKTGETTVADNGGNSQVAQEINNFSVTEENSQPVSTSSLVTNSETATSSSVASSSLASSPTASLSAATSTPIASSTSSLGTGSLESGAIGSSSVKISDSDNDGLSDQEETTLGTDLTKADTDGDSYGDKTEVGNLFNPLGQGTITNDTNISEYLNSKQKYSLFYPKSFSANDAGNGDGSLIVFSAPSDYSIKVSAEKNSSGQDIVAWYNSEHADNPIKSSDVAVKDGWRSVFSPNKNEYYAFDPSGEKIYTITYVSSTDNTYYNIFLLIINSLKETGK
jgi:hypothetical protein